MQVDNKDDTGVVAAHLKCQTSEARYLWVLDPGSKIKNKGDYDIGGTYSDEPEFWFLYRTHSYLQNHLMSLFICNRRPGSFTISIGSSKTIAQHSGGDSENIGKFIIDFNDAPEYIDFYNLPKDTFSFVKTLCFTPSEVNVLDDTDLFIAINVESDQLNPSADVLASVKLNHDFGKLLTDPVRSDLMLESCDGHKFPVHKAIVAANSSYFRNLLEDLSTISLKLNESAADVECLLQFIYTGGIDHFDDMDCIKLMNMGTKYNIRGLTQLSQHTLLSQINIDNAVDVLLIAHNYQLKLLHKEVCQFIRDHPDVFNTKAWIDLKNVEITKELFQYISTGKFL